MIIILTMPYDSGDEKETSAETTGARAARNRIDQKYIARQMEGCSGKGEKGRQVSLGRSGRIVREVFKGINNSRRSGEKNNFWKGGRSIASNGYVLIRVGLGHHLADVRGYAYEHRLVAERKLGRQLLPGEEVHHKDKNKQNNNQDNLEVVNDSQHGVHHRRGGKAKQMPGEENPIICCACGCGESFQRYDGARRERLYIPGHNSRKQENLIRSALKNGPLSRTELAQKTGKAKHLISVGLSKLHRAGIVEQIGLGLWTLNAEFPDLQALGGRRSNGK